MRHAFTVALLSASLVAAPAARAQNTTGNAPLTDPSPRVGLFVESGGMGALSLNLDGRIREQIRLRIEVATGTGVRSPIIPMSASYLIDAEHCEVRTCCLFSFPCFGSM